MYIGMIETRSLKIFPKSFHENYSDLFKKTTRYVVLKNLRLIKGKAKYILEFRMTLFDWFLFVQSKDKL